MGWKHRELLQIIKNILAKYTSKRGAGERNFLLGRSAGLLSKLSTETQSGTLCVGLGQQFVLLLCVCSWGCLGGTSPQSEYLHVEASESSI